MMRKTGKSHRQGVLFRQIVQTWRENQAPWKHSWKPPAATLDSRSRLERPAWKVQRICVWDTDSLMKSGRIHRFFYIFRQTLQILCRNQARLIQALRVGDCFEETTFSLRAAFFSPHASTFSPFAEIFSPYTEHIFLLSAHHTQKNSRLNWDF